MGPNEMERGGEYLARGTGVRLPEGFRDLLPPLSERKRSLEAAFHRVLSRWSYAEIRTPLIEFYDILALGSGNGVRERIFRFVDRHGQVLALRSDMTTPVARVAATRLTDDELPARLFYIGSVFRYDRTGALGEIYQAGAELIGLSGARCDAEMISIAVECLREAGIEGFKIGLGHAGFLTGLLDAIGVPPEPAFRMRSSLERRDLVEIERTLNGLDLSESDRSVLMAVASLRPRREVLHSLLARFEGSDVGGSIRYIDEMFSYLEELGCHEPVYLDFGVIRDFDYYTGMVFEIYVPGVGQPVGGGGRYDGLIGRFGRQMPATGFALNISGLMQRVDERGR